ncbi:hypothetical protein P7C71_g4071, partial [Lecanoromycetidae sp. Uapishka_2]
MSADNPVLDDVDGWGQIGLSQAYAQVERLTVPLALELLKRIENPGNLSRLDIKVHDNGCGIGAMTNALKSSYPRLQVHATDASAGMCDVVNTRMKQEEWLNVTTEIADSRSLSQIDDDWFDYTFSTFMICLAPEPHRIAQEMNRVTKPGGILALAVWADPWFSYLSDPWTKACKQVDARYERLRIMNENWTDPEQVKAGLQEAGFKDVVLVTEKWPWTWASSEEFIDYFIEGGNPGNQRQIDAWNVLGRSVDEVRPIFKRVVESDYGQPDGQIKGYVPAHLVTARK